MSIIPELASQQGRKDEEPNKIIGRRLVESGDLAGIREAAENLSNPSWEIRVDCLGVLEQVGLLAPELIAEFGEQFLDLACGRDIRLAWQSLINLALIAERRAELVLDHFNEICQLVQDGTVITRDNGIKVLARARSALPEHAGQVFPFLLQQLQSCPPKSLPQYAESVLVMVNAENQDDYLALLHSRLAELSPAQGKRLGRILQSMT